ncbi:MAG TPA: hypothetical protein VIH42_15060 [Thermoguttaceae bacterium]
MNTDEKFNYWSERAARLFGNFYAEKLERTMSQMLEYGVSPTAVFHYAKRDLELEAKYPGTKN